MADVPPPLDQAQLETLKEPFLSSHPVDTQSKQLNTISVKQQLQFIDTNNNKANSIEEFYANKRVLITGGTGFIGKVLIEKLLYSCPNVGKVTLLMRASNGKSPKERLVQMLENKPFTFRLRSDIVAQKVEAIESDLTKPQLGLSDEKFHQLAANTDIIFHVAASVKFEATLEFNFEHNVVTTRNLLDLACKCSKYAHFNCFVHVSTAYSHCHRQKIDEKVYKMNMPSDSSCHQLLATPNVLQGRPNSYTYTKAFAESVVAEYASCVRNVTIARPSIVMSANKEPSEGWVDTINGPVGLSVLGALGILQTMKVNSTVVFDLIPVDFVASALISIGWAVTEHRAHFNSPQLCNKFTKDATDTCSEDVAKNNSALNCDTKGYAASSYSQPAVFNLTSGSDNPCTFYEFFNKGCEWSRKTPSIRALRPILEIPHQVGMSNIRYTITTFFTHVLFGYTADLLLNFAGQKPMVMKAVHRMHHANDILHFFCANQWRFDTGNVRKLHELKSSTDARKFPSDLRDLNWNTYALASWMGCRRFILKESDDNLPDARNRYAKLVLGYNAFKLALVLVACLVARFLLLLLI